MGRPDNHGNVNINGDFVIKYDFLNLYKSYTPTFLGGGTISKLRTEFRIQADFGMPWPLDVTSLIPMAAACREMPWNAAPNWKTSQS